MRLCRLASPCESMCEVSVRPRSSPRRNAPISRRRCLALSTTPWKLRFEVGRMGSRGSIAPFSNLSPRPSEKRVSSPRSPSASGVPFFMMISLTAVSEIIMKKGTPDAEGDRGELTRFSEGLGERFEKGAIEPLLPIRPTSKRNFQGVVERAKHRRREIGAFLRGLDLGRTETSHMDSHGEASLQSLMEWAARLENLAEADEPDQADYAQFHRGLDQLENTTEALIVDVELTLRRLRDRVKA